MKRKPAKKPFSLPKLPFIELVVPNVCTEARHITFAEYVDSHRRYWVLFSIWATGSASVVTTLMSTTANDWLWIFPILTILLVMAEAVWAYNIEIEPKLMQWVKDMRSYFDDYELAVRIWNYGLTFSVEEAIATKTTDQLAQKYWELLYAKKYLSEVLAKAQADQMSEADWERLKEYMVFFREHCRKQ